MCVGDCDTQRGLPHRLSQFEEGVERVEQNLNKPPSDQGGISGRKVSGKSSKGVRGVHVESP